jgi:polyisoprenoid-binding protein YceI
MTSTLTTDFPGYLAGSWSVDPVHSEVSLTVRHLMVSKVRAASRASTARS